MSSSSAKRSCLAPAVVLGIGVTAAVLLLGVIVTVYVGTRSAPLRIRPIGSQTVEAGRSLTVAVSVENPEHWEGRLQYRLAPEAPTGATIDAATGVLTWTPTPEQGPGSYEVTVLAAGPHGREAEQGFAVTVTRPLPSGEEIAVDLGGGLTMELVLIRPGEFLMGSPDSDPDAQGDEKPQHPVRITRPFYLGKYEVTQEQWQVVMGSNPSKFESPKAPVEQVSWDDCQAFLGKLNDLYEGRGATFRLPTEAEWEYACRAESRTRWCFGDDEASLGEYAWYEANSGGSTHPVGRMKANGWGLYDVHGNVWEWCADWYDRGYYRISPSSDPEGPDYGSSRVLRGGSWRVLASSSRTSYRISSSPEVRNECSGFRVARTFGDGPSPDLGPAAPEPLRIRDVPPQTVEAGSLLTVPVSVENAEQWEGKLQYRLGPEAPSGARIDPSTGTFTWTPTEQQGPGTQEVAVLVEGPEGQRDETGFTITVTRARPDLGPEAPEPLRVKPIRPQTVEAGRSLAIAVSVENAERWEGKLQYRLGPGAPSGATVYPATGMFTWTPTQEQGPGTYKVTVLVEGPNGQSGQTSLTIAVRPPLRIQPISEQTITPGNSLEVAVGVENAAYWKGKLKYSLVPEAPRGAKIDELTGVFTWAPTEEQAPRTYQVPVLVRGPDGQSDQTSLTIAVSPVLRIQPISAQSIELGSSLEVPISVENAAYWRGKLKYSLGTKAPGGAEIDEVTGEFTWTPTEEQAPRRYKVTVLVTGPDSKRDQQSFTVTVAGPREISVDLGRGVTMEMMLILPGEFLMGSPDWQRDAQSDEKPRHTVRITQPFYLGKYEVTQEQWEAVMDSNPSQFNGPENPVEQVSWDDCQDFLKRLNEKQRSTGAAFRLPTEAEWEYACRAGSTTRWSFGDDQASLEEYAWYSANSGSSTHPVGRKRPNSWGLYDAHGNVDEWCADWYEPNYYRTSPPNDPEGPVSGSDRVLRGGSWFYGARYARSAFRFGYPPVERYRLYGFRVAGTP